MLVMYCHAHLDGRAQQQSSSWSTLLGICRIDFLGAAHFYGFSLRTIFDSSSVDPAGVSCVPNLSPELDDNYNIMLQLNHYAYNNV